MKDVKVEDISSPNEPKLVFEHLNITLSDTDLKFSHAFVGFRFKKAKLRVFERKRYRWTTKFTAPLNKLFLKVNFEFINYTLLTAEQRQRLRFDISLFVGPERKCVLDHRKDHLREENTRKFDHYFTCDRISFDSYKKDIENPGDYMIIETQLLADHYQPYDLVGIFFFEAYGTKEEPLCGEPEVAVSQVSRMNVRYKDYTIECQTEKGWTKVSKKNDIIPETSIHGLKCVADMQWNGSYPECIPLNPCPLDELLSSANSNHTVINSLDGLYFFNKTQFYAYEGTEVDYTCAKSSDDLVGKQSTTCLKKGVWSNAMYICYGMNNN